MPVAVVTDSTACLPPELVEAHRITVVPLTVVLNGAEGLEGVETFPADAVRALSARRVSVSTSRPSPEQFARTYRDLLDAGADAVVSLHLSAGLSGTVEAARLAAAEVDPKRVVVADCRSTGMGLGFPVLAAAVAAERGADPTGVRRAALTAVQRTTSFFYVDTLEFLRRGGRINAAEALLGTALSVKPIMHLVDGTIAVRDKVRTGSRGVTRLVELVAEAAGDDDVDVAVQHLAAAHRAGVLLDALRARLGDRVRHAYLGEAGAVLAAHAGPGMVGVAVLRLAAPTDEAAELPVPEP
ncbi:DegV family protein [Micromonospora sp. NPDC000207]|uniref:DegV family protein n=1 Tax=Micromonospora sp. NPDC000207 TaxID=3154246 RepID=UPI00331B0B16